jgi:hypothetical protein
MSDTAVGQRRESRREEFADQAKLAEQLAWYLPEGVFWSSLDNKLLSRLSGYLQKKRGLRAGLPDLMVLHEKPVFVELKSKRGVLSKVQRQVAAELQATGAKVWMARSARAAMLALHLSGVGFRRQWKPLQLPDWEGPFPHTLTRVPQHPAIALERAGARRRWRERQACREKPKPPGDQQRTEAAR